MRNASEAFAYLGAMRRNDIANMVRALSMHDWLNTWDESQRLRAGIWALAHWPQFMRETYLRLNRKGM